MHYLEIGFNEIAGNYYRGDASDIYKLDGQAMNPESRGLIYIYNLYFTREGR